MIEKTETNWTEAGWVDAQLEQWQAKGQVFKVPYLDYHGWRLVEITGVYPEPRRTTRVGVVTVNEPHESFNVFAFNLEPVDVVQVCTPHWACLANGERISRTGEKRKRAGRSPRVSKDNSAILRNSTVMKG